MNPPKLIDDIVQRPADEGTPLKELCGDRRKQQHPAGRLLCPTNIKA
jgi:hypothetical protein